MIQSYRQIKSRIASIQNTAKVTSAMEMVSVAKLNRINQRLFSLKPYSLKLESIFHNLAGSLVSASSPFFEERQPKGKIGLCVITSDGGLCGTYNNNVIRTAEEFLGAYGQDSTRMVLIGRKGFNHFRKKGAGILNSYIGLNGRYSEGVSEEICRALISSFLSKEVDEMNVIYVHSMRTLINAPILIKLFPLEKLYGGRGNEYILEPDAEGILKEIVPKYLSVKIKLIILEAFASEHSARAIAMKMATDNARELLQKLTILRNKVRQASITQDMMEIISSAEALRG